MGRGRAAGGRHGASLRAARGCFFVLCLCAVGENMKQEGGEKEERTKREEKKRKGRKEKKKNMENFLNLKNFGEKNKRQFMKLVKIIFVQERNKPNYN
jgi:hypothetical protein